MSSTEFASRTRALEQGTRELLASRVRPPSRLSDPELRKNLERLYRAMVDAQRLAVTGDLDESKQNDLLARLDGVDPTQLNSQSLGLILEAIDEFLIEHGDALFICQLLAAEHMRARAESGTTVLTWTDLFPGPPLEGRSGSRRARTWTNRSWTKPATAYSSCSERAERATGSTGRGRWRGRGGSYGCCRSSPRCSRA